MEKSLSRVVLQLFHKLASNDYATSLHGEQRHCFFEMRVDGDEDTHRTFKFKVAEDARPLQMPSSAREIRVVFRVWHSRH